MSDDDDDGSKFNDIHLRFHQKATKDLSHKELIAHWDCIIDLKNTRNAVGNNDDAAPPFNNALWDSKFGDSSTLEEYSIDEIKEVYDKLYYVMQNRVSQLPITKEAVRQHWDSMMVEYQKIKFDGDWKSEKTSDAIESLPNFEHILSMILALNDNEERWQMGIEMTQNLARVLFEVLDYGFKAVNGSMGDWCPDLGDTIGDFWEKVVKVLPKDESTFHEAYEKLANILDCYGDLKGVFDKVGITTRAHKRKRVTLASSLKKNRVLITVEKVRQKWNEMMVVYENIEFGDYWKSEQTSDAIDSLPKFEKILSYVFALSDNEERWRMGIEMTQNLANVLLEVSDYGFKAVNGSMGEWCPDLAGIIIKFWQKLMEVLPKEDSTRQEAHDKLANVLGDYGDLGKVLRGKRTQSVGIVAGGSANTAIEIL